MSWTFLDNGTFVLRREIIMMVESEMFRRTSREPHLPRYCSLRPELGFAR